MLASPLPSTAATGGRAGPNAEGAAAIPGVLGTRAQGEACACPAARAPEGSWTVPPRCLRCCQQTRHGRPRC